MKQALLALGVFLVVFAITVSVAPTAEKKPSAPSMVYPAPMTASDSKGIAFAFDDWQQDAGKFTQGITLVLASAPDYEMALKLFQENIQKFPKAKDLDYPYGWATICLARLKRFDESLAYYRIMRERYYGMQQGGASGAVRVWDQRLEEVRNIVKAENSSPAQIILEEMQKSDKLALEKFGPVKPLE